MASKLARARIGMTNLRRKYKSSEPLRAVSAFGGGALAGTLERTGVLPITILGMPAKPVMATTAFIIAANSRQASATAAVAYGVGEGVLGAYGYAAGKAGTLIAGEFGEEDLEIETEESDL